MMHIDRTVSELVPRTLQEMRPPPWRNPAAPGGQLPTSEDGDIK
jgi:hypothetical protein